VLNLATTKDIDVLLTYDHHLKKDQLKQLIQLGYVFSIIHKQKTIGILRFNLWYQHIPCVELIFIDFAYHRQGIGKVAMQQFEHLMREHGYSHVMTTTQADEMAYLFYEHLGYQKIGHFIPPGQDAQELVYLKKIK
jgi:GNAT superfamily N-acetyltransferase